MTAPLTPALALACLRELSLDVRAAVVLDAEGVPVAGDAEIAARAGRQLDTAAVAEATDGSLHVARTQDGGAIAALAGDFVLGSLLDHDLATLAAALETRAADRSDVRDLPS